MNTPTKANSIRAVNTELRYFMDFWRFSTNDEVNAVITWVVTGSNPTDMEPPAAP